MRLPIWSKSGLIKKISKTLDRVKRIAYITPIASKHRDTPRPSDTWPKPTGRKGRVSPNGAQQVDASRDGCQVIEPAPHVHAAWQAG